MNLFQNWKKDIPASIVVFFVALPLCLGVALASGAPLFAGIIAGIVGGIVVGLISKSQIGVSGPAAGLVVIVLTAITDLGAYELFLVAVVIAGIFQILLGILKAGVIGYYFPSSVIKGMLCAIGISIFLKQIPLALGYTEAFSFSNFSLDFITPGAIIITAISLFILIVWDNILGKKSNFFKLLPGSLVAVLVGILYQVTIGDTNHEVFSIDHNLLVKVPVPESVSDFLGQFTMPDFASGLTNPMVWQVAFTIAIVASLETLLSVEATDKLDPLKRQTPTNRELIAQGVGNSLAGLIGGLPVTQVIVRSSANAMSGGLTKLSTITHGVLLLVSVISIPMFLNLIPNAVLASILLVIGYKLGNPKQFLDMKKLGKDQLIPFAVTVIAILATDLLKGIIIGLIVGVVVSLIKSYNNSHVMLVKEGNVFHMNFAEEVTFVNRGAIVKELDGLKPGSNLELDVRKTRILDYDIIEYLDEFKVKAKNNNINIRLISERGTVDNPPSFREFFGYVLVAGAH
ncbi:MULTISPECIES: SulP family inorganic anion transporter [Empedobacter]|uniref:SulP family inorganic anion transporter n=1 Tax=Empedobacter TaxID=59734 RepID=UPI002578447C|nr:MULTISPECIES: SulP family inorganic anion transporter [Empedobacter]MDM1042092.1 SulP family inorganic anion transporter [Empedobacter brevis]MDM1136033.1 SulP family inorganic anion transporter [Empedobacter sp. R750]